MLLLTDTQGELNLEKSLSHMQLPAGALLPYGQTVVYVTKEINVMMLPEIKMFMGAPPCRFQN